MARVHVLVRIFHHPSESFGTFECSCGGRVMGVELPVFTKASKRYSLEARCRSCDEDYFVLGISDPSDMPHAKKLAHSFLKQLGREYGGGSIS